MRFYTARNMIGIIYLTKIDKQSEYLDLNKIYKYIKASLYNTRLHLNR